MNYIIIGCLGFVLLLIYDINSIIWKNKLIHTFFFLGFICIGISTIGAIWSLRDVFLTNFYQNIGWLVSGLTFIILLIHALFFALPFDKTYINEKDDNKVYSEGVYALCRHPGVLWYIGLYSSLYFLIKTPLMLTLCIIFSFLNFAYVIFQDLWTFPKLFVDYQDYKERIPFLIPNFKSIRQCLSTLRLKTGASYEFKE